MYYKQLVGPSYEPVDMEEIKKHAVISSDDDNMLVQAWILVARSQVEMDTGRALIEQQWQLSLECFPDNEITLPKPPLVSIESIEFIDTAGIRQTMAAEDYQIGSRAGFGCVKPAYGKSWPSVRECYDAVLVTFTAGYIGSDGYHEVPPQLMHAISVLVAHFDQNREIAAPVTLHETPMAYQSLIADYQVLPR